MGRPREELQELFLLLTPYVYFQPPAKLKMEYPAIVYEGDTGDSKFADNSTYSHTRGYQVMIIDRDPDTVLYDVIVSLPYCRHVRRYAVDDLNHYVFNLYF